MLPFFLYKSEKYYIIEKMIKEFTTYVATTAVSLACLGLIALVMVRDRIKDSDDIKKEA